MFQRQIMVSKKSQNKMTDAEKLKMYEEVLCDIMDNFDHDEDAHRYDTPCRVCMAENVLVGKDPWTNNELES